jgi:hypothetical protein
LLAAAWARGSDGEYLYHYGEIEGQGSAWIAVAERYSGAMEASSKVGRAFVVLSLWDDDIGRRTGRRSWVLYFASPSPLVFCPKILFAFACS